MAEIAPSRSILFGTSKGFAPVPHVDIMDPFPSESSLLFEDIHKLAGKTEPFRLTTMFSENGPRSAWSGLAIGVKSLASELRSNEVAYETADHKLGIAFPKHVEVVKPTGIGGARAQHLEMCGQRMARIIERGELAKLAEAYVASGKQINEQWLWDTFNTKSSSGLRDILHEYSDALQTTMEETWKDLAFGKLPEKPLPTAETAKDRFTVSKGSMPIENVFQVVTAEHALSPVVQLTTMDKANIGVVLIIGAAANSGCVPIQAVTPTETVQIPSPKITPEIPTDVQPTTKPTEQKPDVTPTNPVAVGPEATPGGSVPYPTELSAEAIKSLISTAEPAIPRSVSENAGVQDIVNRHTAWAKDAGLDFDTMQIHMAPDGEHWYLVPEKNGAVAGWLMIEDPSSQTGWRYAEQPTWDSKFDPFKDTFKFGLPDLRNGADHWDVVHAGFPILTEVAANGEPQYWNSAVAKTMIEATGAEIVEDLSVYHEKVQADPWTATDAEKAKSDEYIINNLHAMLKEAGVANAEKLQGYELLEAVIDYQQGLIAKGGLENPEDYLVELPISLHELIRTDVKNLVPVHYDESRSTTYGIGGTVYPDKDRLLYEVKYLPGFSFYGKDIPTNTTAWLMNGDMVLLYKTPGVDSDTGIGAVIRMYDGDKVAYAEVFIATINAPISPGDLCLFSQVGAAQAAVTCDNGAQRSQAWITMNNSEKKVTLTDWLELMKKYKNPSVEITPAGVQGGLPMWSDGTQIGNNFTVLEK